MPVTPQTLNINNLRITGAKSINLEIIRKLIKYSFKNVTLTQCLLLPFWRYCCSMIGRYYHTPSGVQGTKGLREKRLLDKKKC